MVDQDKIQNIIGYRFQSIGLLTEALEAAGRALSHKTVGDIDGNKRLALLGDALLQLVHVGCWFPSGQDRENAQNKLRPYASNANLQKCAEELGITEEILPNPAQRTAGKVSKTTAASTMEALLAAVWLDSNKNFEQVRQVAYNLGVAQREE